MSHIPVFCWILSTVLQHVLETKTTDLPQTLTQMYIHFLVVQAKVKNLKYDGHSETDPLWTPETRKMVESLGKLAFEQLQKGNLIFYESDLRDCGIDVVTAAVYSGVFTQVFREEPGLYQDKVYCFIHLSVQEFLAALHVHQTFFNSGVNLMSTQPTSESPRLTTTKTTELSFFSLGNLFIGGPVQTAEQTNERPESAEAFYRSAVDQALESQNGHLDLFLRFLLGLSLSTNQTLLQGLLTQTRRVNRPCRRLSVVNYIQKKLSDVSTEKSMNLFHCLNELNDHSLVQQMQQNLSSGGLSKGKLSPAQWSALAFILLSSEEHLDEFELNKYCASEEALLRLLPVVKASNNALLSRSDLSERSCVALSSVLSSSSLRVLDLSNNPLKDSGVEQLCVGLKSPHCKLEQLRLSHCLVSEEGCASLASALRSNPSHLRELDLSYNHPGDTGVQLLRAVQEDPNCRLESVRLSPAGVRWLTPVTIYHCDLTLDPNTAHRLLKLSDNNKKATRVKEEQPDPDHQDRFQDRPQLLYSTALTGRCYWEVQWSGEVSISVCYGDINREGDSDERYFGWNDDSWGVSCSKDSFQPNDEMHPHRHRHFHDDFFGPFHNLHPFFSSSSSGTIGVYVDVPARSLSFHDITSSGELKRFMAVMSSSLTEPLYARFGLKSEDSSVTL